MLSGQWSIRVSRNDRVILPRLRLSPSLSGVTAGPGWWISLRVLAPMTEEKTFSGFTWSITSIRHPEWSISEWLETMYWMSAGLMTDAMRAIISSRNGALTVSISVILSARTR